MPAVENLLRLRGVTAQSKFLWQSLPITAPNSAKLFFGMFLKQIFSTLAKNSLTKKEIFSIFRTRKRSQSWIFEQRTITKLTGGYVMKKRNYFKWAAIGIVCLLLLGILWIYLFTWPVYPDFRKDVDSYEALLAGLADVPDVCIPDISGLELRDGSYQLVLEDRTLFSPAEGYDFHGYIQMYGIEVGYGFHGEGTSQTYFQGDERYRDIPLRYNYDMNSNESGIQSHKFDIDFYIGNHIYRFYASYDSQIFNDEQIDSLNGEVQSILKNIVYTSIDHFLDG